MIRQKSLQQTLFLTFVLCTMLASGVEASRYKYFHHLPFRESPYEKVIGIHEASKSVLDKKNHFRLAYDEKGRMTEIAFMRNGRLVINTSYDNFFITSSRTEITYTEKEERWTYFDFTNTPESVGNVFSAVYQLDEKGNRRALKYLDVLGNPTEDHWGIHRYEWSEEREGRVREKRFNLKNEPTRIRPDFEFYEVELVFDNRGFLTHLYNYGTTGVLTNNSSGVAYDELTYDKKGNFTSWRVFNNEGKAVVGNPPMTAGGNHFYDATGYNVKMVTVNLDGKPMVASWGYAWDEKIYDAFGNLSIHFMFDEKDAPIPIFPGSDAVAAERLFNEVNQNTEMSYLDKNQKPFLDPRQNVATARYIYEGKRVIERRFFGLDGKPSENTRRKCAAERYVFDQKGALIDTLQFDANGVQLPAAARKLKMHLRPIAYLPGKWNREVIFSDGKGGWLPSVKGTVVAKPVLDGTFVEEEIILLPEGGRPQHSKTLIGYNPETDTWRMASGSADRFGKLELFAGTYTNGQFRMENTAFSTDEEIVRITAIVQDSGTSEELIMERSKDRGKTWTVFCKMTSRKVAEKSV